MKKDVYQEITDQIVSELQQGVRPWLKHGMPSTWQAEPACRA
jgi:antirestriction protein ArdC